MGYPSNIKPNQCPAWIQFFGSSLGIIGEFTSSQPAQRAAKSLTIEPGIGTGKGGAFTFFTLSLTCLPSFAPRELSAFPRLPLRLLMALRDFLRVSPPVPPEDEVEVEGWGDGVSLREEAECDEDSGVGGSACGSGK